MDQDKAVAALDGRIYAHDRFQLYGWATAGLPAWAKLGPPTMFGNKMFAGAPAFSPSGAVMYVALNPPSNTPGDGRVLALNVSMLPSWDPSL